MAEEKKVVETKDTKKERVPFKITNEGSFDAFPEMGMVTLMRGRELAGIAHDIFDGAFQNLYGANTTVWPGSNVPIVDLFFMHADDDASDPRVSAINKTGESNGVKNKVLRETRSYLNRVQFGDRYYMTEDGEEGIEPFLIYNRTIFNNNKPNWAKIVSEVSEPRNFGVPQQLTQVAYLDPAAILRFKYGDTNENGEKINYIVNVLKSIAPVQGANADLELIVFRVNEDETMRLANDFGIVSSGLNIVR